MCSHQHWNKRTEKFDVFCHMARNLGCGRIGMGHDIKVRLLPLQYIVTSLILFWNLSSTSVLDIQLLRNGAWDSRDRLKEQGDTHSFLNHWQLCNSIWNSASWQASLDSEHTANEVFQQAWIWLQISKHLPSKETRDISHFYFHKWCHCVAGLCGRSLLKQ